MSGSPSKQPGPSSKEGKARDTEVQRMLDERQDDGQRAGLLRLIKRAAGRAS